MGKSSAKAVLAVAALCMLPALPARAADLVLKVDAVRHSVAVTNNLPTAVHVLYLRGEDGKNMSLPARINKGMTAQVPLRFEMPDSVSAAVGEVAGQRRDLTVEIQ